MTDNENKYWAFLSYSHQDNREQRADTQNVSHLCWGNWLHDALKTFSIPAEFVGQINGRGEIIPALIDPIFRDESALPDEANLSAESRQALAQSICLIVICSPRSARSLQVNEAVRYFKQRGRDKYILPIVIAGEPNASADNQPDQSPEAECFVPALRHPVLSDGTQDITRRAAKHIFVDARHGVAKREILANDHRNAEADLAMAKIQLIALLIGVGFNGLWEREQKRHFFDLAAAQHQAREALNQVEEVRRQLQEAQRQTREAQSQALEIQNLPRDVHGQIQETQNQALAAQNQAREAQKQLQEVQNKVRDTQTQLEEARHRALAAESKVLEAQNQAREARNQLETTRNQVREVQSTQSQLEADRQQTQQDAQSKLLEAQSQVQEIQNQARSAQRQLEEDRQQVREAQSQVVELQHQAREAQNQVPEIQNQTRDAQNQMESARHQILAIQNQNRNARRLTKVFALLAVLGLLTAGLAASLALRQGQIANQALAKVDAQEVWTSGRIDQEWIKQALQNIAGAETARRMDQLAAAIPMADIPEALQASAVMVNDQQRSHFQKWLLVRLGWVNPVSAMTSATGIEEKIVNDAGMTDSGLYFQLAVLDNWMQTDLPAAFNWVCQLPDADARQRALEKIIPALFQPSGAGQVDALNQVVANWTRKDPSAVAQFARQHPELFGDTLGDIAEASSLGDWSAAWKGINRLDLPPAIMRPRKFPLPWTQFLLNSTLGSLTMFPVETERSSTVTNDPVQIQPPE